MHPTKGFDDSHIFRHRQYVCTSMFCHTIFDPRDVEAQGGDMRLKICPVCKQGFLANFINMDNLEYRNWKTLRETPYNGPLLEDPFNAVSADELAEMSQEEIERIKAMGPYKKYKQIII